MILLYNKRDLVGSLFIINIKCLSGGPGRTVEGVGKLSLFSGRRRFFGLPKEKLLLISEFQGSKY